MIITLSAASIHNNINSVVYTNNGADFKGITDIFEEAADTGLPHFPSLLF